MGGKLFFAADDGVHGRELWTSDGTAAGTRLVKDINPGRPGPDDFAPQRLTRVGRQLFFQADDGVRGRELWKSDGTDAGTRLVKDIKSGRPDLYDSPEELTSVGGELFFRGNDGVHGLELWRSDGTAAGTRLVKDIRSGRASFGPHNFKAVGRRLFFAANDGKHGYELWTSDGTAAGTRLVRDVWPGRRHGSRPDLLTNVRGTLFFVASEPRHGKELWKVVP